MKIKKNIFIILNYLHAKLIKLHTLFCQTDVQRFGLKLKIIKIIITRLFQGAKIKIIESTETQSSKNTSSQ